MLEEPFHLFRYLDEQVFRYNNRESPDADRFKMVCRAIAERTLTYAEGDGRRIVKASDTGTKGKPEQYWKFERLTTVLLAVHKQEIEDKREKETAQSHPRQAQARD